MKPKVLLQNLVVFGIFLLMGGGSVPSLWAETTSSAAHSSTSPATTKPLDLKYAIRPTQWKKVAKAEWLSPRVRSAEPFDELIYNWKVRLPRDMGFRLYLKVFGDDGVASPWLYAGFWGSVPLVENRTNPKFEFGELDQDQLKLTRKVRSFQFKLVDEGRVPLTVRPAMNIIVTDNSAPAELVARYVQKEASQPTSSSIVLDVPINAQLDSGGNWLPDRCQSAALGAALQYFGTTVPLEHIIFYTTDPEYKSFGIWPRTINAAIELGFDAYIDRFRDWEKVRRTVAENKVILCSITMPPAPDYVAPPYRQMPGHIVALCGVTDDGRVVVTDSALAKSNRGYLCQWLLPDFERVWMRNKGGVGMVICPPKNATLRPVKNLPPFPYHERARNAAETTGTLQQAQK